MRKVRIVFILAMSTVCATPWARAQSTIQLSTGSTIVIEDGEGTTVKCAGSGKDGGGQLPFVRQYCDCLHTATDYVSLIFHTVKSSGEVVKEKLYTWDSYGGGGKAMIECRKALPNYMSCKTFP